MPDSADKRRKVSCSADISREKIPVAKPLRAASSAIHIASAVLPIEGRAARTIKSLF